MFGTFVIEQDPLSFKNLPNQLMNWVQSVGGVAAIGLFFWVILWQFGLFRKATADVPRWTRSTKLTLKPMPFLSGIYTVSRLVALPPQSLKLSRMSVLGSTLRIDVKRNCSELRVVSLANSVEVLQRQFGAVSRGGVRSMLGAFAPRPEIASFGYSGDWFLVRSRAPNVEEGRRGVRGQAAA